MSLVIAFFVARWAWPGCVASWRCRRRGCQHCTLLVPCDAALRRLMFPLPRAERPSRGSRFA